MDENVTIIAGVPSWMLVLLNRILELKGSDHFKKCQPNLEVYFHGGVSFNFLSGKILRNILVLK
ncbi:MAG: hypothetical protein IPM51_15290 [Sphingobacteriaceae bacterium]|nr:hypothetical protein [Sphingobacteriaceae bacterium]